MRRVLAATALLAATVLAGGCGGSGDETDDGRPEIVVFAAASLEPAFEKYADQFEPADVKFSFAGSDDLAAQIRQGVIPDVYAAANTDLPKELAKDGLLQEPRTFATNRLVIGVPSGSDIDDVSDLTRPGLSIAIGEKDVPVGSYTREVLAALGPADSKAILANVASEEPDVAGIVAKLTQGAVDAGFVYQSDVDASSGRLQAVQLPRDVSPDVAYGIAVTADASEPAAAQEFVDGARVGVGQKILRESGFGPPPPGG
jgi:molybdate transport system substrate-binding protein